MPPLPVSIRPYTAERSGRRLWRARWRDPETRRQREKKGFPSKRDATVFAAALQRDAAAGVSTAPTAGRATIAEIGAAFMAARQTRVAASTFYSDQSAWRTHILPRWGDSQVGKISRSAVQAWLVDLAGHGLSGTHLARVRTLIVGVLAEAAANGLISRNPAADVRAPKPRARPAPTGADDDESGEKAYLTAAQVETLRRAVRGEQQQRIVLTLSYLGLRWAELTFLRVRHWRPQDRRLRIEGGSPTVGGAIVDGPTKTGAARTVAVPAFLVPVLDAQAAGRARGDRLFGAGGTEPIRRPSSGDGWFDTAVRRARDADPDFPAGLTPHMLRHTAASLAVSSGASVLVIARMLGHADPSETLRTYADLFDTDLDDVAARLDAVHASAVGKIAHISPTSSRDTP